MSKKHRTITEAFGDPELLGKALELEGCTAQNMVGMLKEIAETDPDPRIRMAAIEQISRMALRSAKTVVRKGEDVDESDGDDEQDGATSEPSIPKENLTAFQDRVGFEGGSGGGHKPPVTNDETKGE